MAAMAMMMKNLDSSFSGEKKEGLTPAMVLTVVMREASTKKRMKKGKIFFRLKALPCCPPAFFA